MILHEIQAKQALHKLSRRGLPYQYDLNIYRGCSHNCAYCYARKSHAYLGAHDFCDDVFVKSNVAEVLDWELGRRSWRGGIINLGGVSDSYQAAEAECRIMPKILKVLIKHRNPVVISTKSDLIVRDRELLDALGKLTYVNVVLCITAADSNVSRAVEPGASTPWQRFRALQALKGIHARRALHFFPILPYLSDNPESLKKIVGWAARAKVDYMMSAMLYLTGGSRNNYFSMLAGRFPKALEKTRSLFVRGSADPAYKQAVHARIAALRKVYGVESDYRRFLPKAESGQMGLKLT